MSEEQKPLIKEQKEPMIMPVKVSLAIGAVGFLIALALIIVFAITFKGDEKVDVSSDS